MPDISELSSFLKSLADPTRLKIVEYLAQAENPRCVNAIAQHIDVSQSATSQHLRILRQANLVNSARRGYHIHYEINTDKMDDALHQLRSLLKK